LEDRRISAKSIAEQLGVSRERLGSIIHEDLDMLVACLLPGRAKDLSSPLYLPAVSDSPGVQVETFEGRHAMLIPHTTPVLCCVDICMVRKTTRHKKYRLPVL
jgi:hypothetical protein